VIAVEWSVVPALLLAGIAPASDAATTVDIIHESHSKGPLARTLLKVVAIDDAIVVIWFSILLSVAELIIGQRALDLRLARAQHRRK
jgi:Kef-type K+ transport system membrane component KefB